MGDRPTGLTVYTIGHSNVAAERIVELLRRHAIVVVVDVRSSPYSQYCPQFNRETLRRTLQAAGIRYEFQGDDLGGRPADPSCYKHGELPTGKANYLDLVDYEAVARQPWYQRGIDHLLEVAGASRAALLCSEEDPDQCHRQHLIAETLLDRGVEVRHIRGQGEWERAWSRAEREAEKRRQPHQLPLF